MPIGNLTSQHLANFYLNALDHFVVTTLRPAGYLRYMDDLVLFGHEKATLWSHKECVAGYLAGSLRLDLKEAATLLAPVTQGLPFLGRRIYPRLVRIRRENLRRSLQRWRRRQRRRGFELELELGLGLERGLGGELGDGLGLGRGLGLEFGLAQGHDQAHCPFPATAGRRGGGRRRSGARNQYAGDRENHRWLVLARPWLGGWGRAVGQGRARSRRPVHSRCIHGAFTVRRTIDLDHIPIAEATRGREIIPFGEETKLGPAISVLIATCHFDDRDPSHACGDAAILDSPRPHLRPHSFSHHFVLNRQPCPRSTSWPAEPVGVLVQPGAARPDSQTRSRDRVQLCQVPGRSRLCL